MKKIILISVACLVLGSAFLAVCMPRKKRYTERPWIPIAEDVQFKAIRVLAKKHGLTPFGFGGALREGVSSISVDFTIVQEAKQDEARELIVECAQDFLAVVDASDALKPYLKSTPCPVETIEITVYYTQPDQESSLIPFVSTVGLHGGSIRYCYNDETTLNSRYKYTKKESYQEALAILSRPEEAGNRSTGLAQRLDASVQTKRKAPPL